MIYCVEVLAIYEIPGVAPTAQRISDRDSDYALAQSRVALVGKAVAPQSNEYEDAFGDTVYSRYGFGWRCRQWITASTDASTVGNTIWTRLATRGLKAGTKVEVFPRDETAPGYSTGAASFKRSIPAQPDDIG